MSYYIPLSKNNYRQEKNLEIQGLRNNMKNWYTPESTILDRGFIPDKMTKDIARKDTKLIYEDIQHNPQNIDFARNIQGAGRKSGMAKYKKQPISGGIRNISATILKHMFLNPLKKGIQHELNQPYRHERGGTKLKDKSPQELEELNQQKLENSIWKKSRQGKQYIGDLNELTNAEKLANIKKVGREYKSEMQKRADIAQELEEARNERKSAREEREYIQNERELARQREANKSIWDTVANEAIGAVASVIPGGKLVQTVAKEGLKQAYKGVRGLGRKKPLSVRQKAHQHKIRDVMDKYNLSFKDALKKIGRHNALLSGASKKYKK